jgi:hypothetical protein
LKAGAPLIVYALHEGENQQFRITYDPATSYYTISNVRSGLPLDTIAQSTGLSPEEIANL